MAFRTKKISQMDPKGASLASTDLLEISELVSGSYVTKSITGAEIIASAPAASWGTITGTLSTQTDLQNALNAKVPTTRTLTINGTTQDLSADRTFTVATGITIGTTAITSGTVGRVMFQGTGNVVQQSANLFWDNVNSRLGVGTSTPTSALQIVGSTNVEGLLNITNNTTLNYANAVNILFPNMVTNNQVAGFYIGKALSSKNGWGVNYIHSADGSNSNRGSIAFYGVDNILNWFASGNVGINTTTDAGFKLDVNGTARVSGALTVTGQLTFVGATSMIFNGAFFNNSNDRNHFGGAISITTFLRIGTNANTVASAILQADSTTKGFLPPRMTTTEKNAIASPATGLMVYDNTINAFNFYNGTSWTNGVTISTGTTPITGGVAGQLLFQGTGNVVQQSANLFWDNTNGRLGVGTANPNSALEVVDTGGASFVAAARFLVPNNNVAGRVSQFYLGQAMTLLNSIAWSFHYQGNGSTANYQSFGFNGIATPALTMFGTLNVGIGTTTDAGFKLDVNGTARVSGTANIVGGLGVNQAPASGTAHFNLSSFCIISTPTFFRVVNGTTDQPFFNVQTASTNSVTIGGASSNASAILDVISTTKGFLPPRMTTAQKNAIATPATGLMVYDTTLNVITYYNGTTWI